MRKGSVWVFAIWWFFYMALTFVCVIAIIKVPENMLEQKVQPIELDALIMEERLFNKVSDYSPVLGVRENILTDNLRMAARLDPSDKKFGYKMNYMFRGKPVSAFGNRDFFVAALPLYKLYDTFTEIKRMKVDGAEVTVSLVQVYPRKYDVK